MYGSLLCAASEKRIVGGIVAENGFPVGLTVLTVSNCCCPVNLSEGPARDRIYEESVEWSV